MRKYVNTDLYVVWYGKKLKEKEKNGMNEKQKLYGSGSKCSPFYSVEIKWDKLLKMFR